MLGALFFAISEITKKTVTKLSSYEKYANLMELGAAIPSWIGAFELVKSFLTSRDASKLKMKRDHMGEQIILHLPEQVDSEQKTNFHSTLQPYLQKYNWVEEVTSKEKKSLNKYNYR